jgi:stage V sporulation protein B
VTERSESSERARRAGRGLVALAAVKGYHIASGYAVAVLLPRLLGSPEVFGLWSKVTAALAILNNVLVAASIQSVSKLVSEDESRGPAIFRRLLGLQLGVGVLAATALFASAPAIAAFHRDAALIPLFRLVSIVPLGYAIYAGAVGFLNGQQRFGRQAGLDAGFYTLRWLGILGAAALIGGGALAPIGGLAAAATVIAALSILAVGVGAPGGGLAYRRWLAFVAPLWLYQAVLNGILELDVQVLARAVSELALEAGHAPALATDLANAHVGFYHAAQTFAFVPYQLLLALTFVAFPMVSRATSTGDEQEARRTIRSAMRLSLLALLSVAAPIAGSARGVMRIAYPEEYLAGAPALEILAPGVAVFSLFVLAGTILAGAGKPLHSAAIAGAGLVVAAAGNYFFVRRAGLGEHTLSAAALGTALGMVVALLLAGSAVYRRFRTLLPALSLVRGGIAAAAGFSAARFTPHDTRPAAVLALAAGLGAYALSLILLRELRGSDLLAIRQLLTRSRPAAD